MIKTRIEKSAINASVAVVSQVISVLLGFIARTIFIKSLSTEYLGINGLFTNILTILSFAELGIGDVMIYNMYKPLKNNDTQKLKALMSFYKKAYMIIAVVITVIGLGIIPFLQYVIKFQPNINEDIAVIYAFYLFNTAASYLLVYKKSIITADQNAYIITI